MRRSSLRLLAAGTLPVLFLAGCGSSGSSASKSSSSAAGSSSASVTSTSYAASEITPINTIKVNTSNAKKPAITLGTKPVKANETTVKVNKEGTGATVGAKQIVSVDYAVLNGRTGKSLANTFSSNSVGIDLTDSSQFPGLVKAIKGKKIGTTETVIIPAKDGFGTTGSSTLGVNATDSLVFYIKINSATTALKQATGTTKSATKGLPTLKWNGIAKAATIKMPNTTAPKSLKQETLIEGKGATVKSGQTVYALYTGVIWKKNANGTVFDSTGSRKGVPSGFVIGKSQVISAWDKVLVGKKVGSRVLMVVPPSDGYGSTGNTTAGIKGTDTLVFVVDIVAAV